MDINVCRVCLSSNTEKDAYKIKCETYGNKSFIEILLCCLNIQIAKDTKFGYKLCLQCYDKVLEYHEFKTLALESDAYFKSLDVKLLEDKNIISEENIKKEDSSYSIDDCFDNTEEFNLEDIKQECLEYLPDDKAIFAFDNNIVKVETKKKAPSAKKTKIKTNEKVHQEKVAAPLIRVQLCGECGESVSDLKEHSKLHKFDRKKYKCMFCEKTFATRGTRYRHTRFIHFNFKYTCDICNKKVTSLSTHKSLIHNNESLTHACTQCGRRFVNQSHLDAHLVTHTKDLPFECQTCESKYKTKLSLDNHIRRVHEQEKSYLCQFCSKGFFRKDKLLLHLRTHTKEKPHKCDECGKYFSTPQSLKGHKIIHTNDKKYECEHCTMTFVKRDYLKLHMISHTKEKRYTCKYCGAKFGRSDHCKRHQFTAHEKYLAAFQTTPTTY